MKTLERPPYPLRRWPVVWVAAILALAVVLSTYRFGSRFLVQFFMNPFQMFIVVPWALSCFYVQRGYMPLRSGGRLERATDPVNFWIGVGFLVVVGMAFFIFNLLLSWLVLSRPR